MKKQILFALVALLLLHLFLRAHDITRLPIFVDEDNHLRRAALVHNLAQHPAQNSHGKWLLYVALSGFDLDERESALHLGRTMVALLSLLNTALIFAIGRRFTGQGVALVGAAFYALAPFALFYERMALADSLSGSMGLFTIWASLRFARVPTYRRAVLVGLFAALTVAAKLTMAFAVGFPVAAVLLLGQYDSWKAGFQHYFPGLVVSGVIFVVLWLPILIPARLSYSTDTPDFIIVNTELAQQGDSAHSLLENIQDAADKTLTLLRWDMVLVLLVLTSAAVLLKPRPAIFFLACLVLAWLPSIVFTNHLQTRYLVSGVPLLALLFALGMAAIFARDESLVSRIVLLGHGIGWAFGFALVFAFIAMTIPYNLNMPPLDARNYFWDRYNGYGTLEALDYLADTEESTSVVLLVTTCRNYSLYQMDNVEQICSDQFDGVRLGVPEWQAAARERLQAGQTVYAITDAWATPDDSFTWEAITSFAKPFDKQQITLWRLGE